MSKLPLPPPPPKPPTTKGSIPVPTPIHVVDGMRGFRKDMSDVFKRCYEGQQVEIIERGFDRKVKAKYKLVKVSDNLPE